MTSSHHRNEPRRAPVDDHDGHDAGRLTLDIEAYRDMWQHGRDAALLVEPTSGRLVEVNDAAEELYALSRDELLRRTISDLRTPSARKDIPFQLKMALDHGLLFETDHITAGGKVSHVEVSSRGVKLGNRVVLHCSIRDITSRVQSEKHLREVNQRLENIAKIDPVTGIANRLADMDYLRAEFERSRRAATPYCVLMIDVDHFKTINDTFGHAAGDEALRRIAQLLVSSVRQSDIVVRFGGEEFVAILPGTDHLGGVKVAESLRSAIEREGGYHNRTLTVSIGVAAASPDDADELAAIGRADHCMYEAKDAGRNLVSACDTSCGPISTSDRC